MTPSDSHKDPLYRDAALAQFYDLENGWAADFDFCLGLAENVASVLDLGCGTGELTAHLAQGRNVVGVDPAAPMLAIARQRPGGDRVTWVEADARALQLDRRFDLVLLTGHAFQCFLRDDDQIAVLSSIAQHLASDGRFIFDSRNPAAEAWRSWLPENSERSIEHPKLGQVTAWNDASMDDTTQVVTYQTCYRIEAEERTLNASAQIRFMEQAVLAERIAGAGLAVDEWLGDWQGNPYRPSSPEIIPLGRLG